ncbi:hypothetical protein BD309DRAFT_134215 [Dichomitus squalens]|nr:hypothetical protein BD309DRAFT_134215 [Dichomitus squalens]
MRRAGSTRATSPTNTTYSGISNYRTDSYKPLMRDAPNKEYTTPDPRAVARIHFEELSQYLAAYLAKVTTEMWLVHLGARSPLRPVVAWLSSSWTHIICDPLLE